MTALLLAGLLAAQISPDEFRFDFRDPQVRPPKRGELPQPQPFIDLRRLELHARVGLAEYSEDYVADAAPAVSLMFRAPMTWLNPESDVKGDYFGLFADVTATTVERDITPVLDNPSGSVLLFSLGADFTFVRDDTWLLRAMAGGQYGTYGGVTDLDAGFAGIVAGTIGYRLSYKFWLTYEPRIVLANAGDWIAMSLVGVMIEF
jgi:hypothetical protein